MTDILSTTFVSLAPRTRGKPTRRQSLEPGRRPVGLSSLIAMLVGTEVFIATSGNFPDIDIRGRQGNLLGPGGLWALPTLSLLLRVPISDL